MTKRHDRAHRWRRPRRRLGLRARSSIASALGALVVAAALSTSTYTIIRSYLLDQRDRVSRNSAFANARLVRNELVLSVDARPVELLQSVRSEPGAQSFLWYEGNWFSPSFFELSSLPLRLRDGVRDGRTGRMRFQRSGEPYIGYSVAIPALGAGYLEVLPLDGLDRTFTTLRGYLAAAAATTAVGGAVLGAWTSRRALKPLSRVAGAVQALARGGLDTRLSREGDVDLERLVISFNEMADALQARIEREARFASDVSHELRTPLAALAASAEVLDGRRNELPDRSRQALDILLSQLRRFDRMVLDLLEISRLDAGASDVHLEPVVIGTFVKRAVMNAGFSGFPVEIEPGAETMYITTDRRRLERVLVNLIENARLHGGAVSRVVVERPRARVESRMLVRIAVEDQGPGVMESDRERIFERFARGRNVRSRQGTGLGLAIVAEHVRALKGRVWVEDPPGGPGARFVVELSAEAELGSEEDGM